MTSKTPLPDRLRTGSKNVKVAVAQRALTIKQTIPINNIAAATAEGSNLKLVINDEEFSLTVGTVSANFLAKKINISNRTLAQKLGIDASKKVLLVGPSENAVFENLSTYAASTVDEASVCLIVAASIAALDELIDIYGLLGARLPIWVICTVDKNPSLEDEVSYRMSDLNFMRRRCFRTNDALSAALFRKRVQNLSTPRFASK